MNRSYLVGKQNNNNSPGREIISFKFIKGALIMKCKAN